MRGGTDIGVRGCGHALDVRGPRPTTWALLPLWVGVEAPHLGRNGRSVGSIAALSIIATTLSRVASINLGQSSQS